MKNFLENQIDKLIQRMIDNEKGYGWKNHPFRSHNGTYILGEPFDYIIISPTVKLAFDAKQTIWDKYKIVDKDIKQAYNLYKMSKYGFDSFFLVLFKMNILKKVDIKTFFNILTNRKYLKIDDGIDFDYKKLFT